MLVSDSMYKVDVSQKAKDRITHLNKRRAQLIQARSHTSKQMAQGYLDYCGITKDAWNWRFESIYNDRMEQSAVDEETGEVIDRPVRNCTFQSAEQMYSLPYTVLEIVRDKIDEYNADINSRAFSLDTLSVPYQNKRYIISHLVKEPFETVGFRESLKTALFDASVKSTGFLRPVIYDIEKEVSEPVVKTVKGKNTIEFKTTKEKVKLGLRIESVDPETVFVDPASEDPKECFIITPYEVEELINKFPMLEKHIAGVERLNTENQTPNDFLVKKESLFNYHVGELIEEIYELGDLKFTHYLNGSNLNEIDFNNIPSSHNEFVQKGDNVLFADGRSSWYYENALNYSLPENRKRQSYFVTEYYNINFNTYCVYIGDILLLESKIMEPFRDLPLVPIYTVKNKRGYYGTPLSKYFTGFQEEYNSANHSQRLSSEITGKTTLIINDSAINEMYHPDRQIVIEKNSPMTQIHVSEMAVDNGIGMGPPITPINTTTGTAENILETRKNSTLNNMERQFPSIKTLSAASNKEAQQDVIFSRDLRTNDIINKISDSLEKLAYKVFPSKILELKLLSKDLKLSIPPYFGSPNKINIVIESTKEDIAKAQDNKIKELTKQYKDQIKQVKDQLRADPNTGGAIVSKVQNQIAQEVVTSFLKQANAELPEDPAQQAELFKAAAQDPKIAPIIAEQVKAIGDPIIDAQLTDMASKQVQVPQDLDLYFSFEDLSELNTLEKQFKFSFKRSQKEIQAALNNLISTIKPFEQFTPYVLNMEEFLRMAIENAGYDPAQMVNEKSPTPSEISRAEQTRRTEIVSYDKNPAVFARFLNDQAGEELFTTESLIAAMQGMLTMESDVKAQEIQVRGQVKAQTDIVKESNKAQIANELSTSDMARQQTIDQASTPQFNV